MRRTLAALLGGFLLLALSQSGWVGPVKVTLSPVPDLTTAPAVSLTGEVGNLPPGLKGRVRLQYQYLDPATGKWVQKSSAWDYVTYQPPAPPPPPPPKPAAEGVLLRAYDACNPSCAQSPPLSWRTRQNMAYKPRQLDVGACFDLDSGCTRKVVLDPGPFKGWDYLALDERTNHLETELTLARPALVGVGLYGPLPPSMADWARKGEMITVPSYSDSGRQAVPVYVKPFPAGVVRLPSFGTVAPVVLLAEADGTPSRPPAYPAGGCARSPSCASCPTASACATTASRPTRTTPPTPTTRRRCGWAARTASSTEWLAWGLIIALVLVLAWWLGQVVEMWGMYAG